MFEKSAKFRAIFRVSAMAAILLASASAAQAACYETVSGEPVLSCNGGIGGNSADFAQNCQYLPGAPVDVEVACPGRWVNKSNEAHTHAETCNTVGMRAASIEGQVCAAGERRPQVGGNAQGISYIYGTWSKGSRVGGTYSEVIKMMTGGDGCGSTDRPCDGVSGPQMVSIDYCWNPGAKKDRDGTDRTVAYYCE